MREFVTGTAAVASRGIRSDGRKNFQSAFAGFLEPFYYLIALGVGLSPFANSFGEASYKQYVAVGLVAVSAMNGALFVCLNPAFARLHYAGIYATIVAGPIGAWQIVLGEVGAGVVRSAVYVAGLVSCAVAVGAVSSPAWILGGFLLSLWIATVFGCLGLAAAFSARSPQHMAVVRLGLMPLILCSGAYFPIDSLPWALRVFAEWSPLYHSVELLRAGTAGMLPHLAYLFALGVCAALWARWRLGIALLS